jgi:hypothetical protein
MDITNLFGSLDKEGAGTRTTAEASRKPAAAEAAAAAAAPMEQEDDGEDDGEEKLDEEGTSLLCNDKTTTPAFDNFFCDGSLFRRGEGVCTMVQCRSYKPTKQTTNVTMSLNECKQKLHISPRTVVPLVDVTRALQEAFVELRSSSASSKTMRLLLNKVFYSPTIANRTASFDEYKKQLMSSKEQLADFRKHLEDLNDYAKYLKYDTDDIQMPFWFCGRHAENANFDRATPKHSAIPYDIIQYLRTTTGGKLINSWQEVFGTLSQKDRKEHQKELKKMIGDLPEIEETIYYTSREDLFGQIVEIVGLNGGGEETTKNIKLFRQFMEGKTRRP